MADAIDYSHQNAALAIMGVFTILAIVLVVLRVWVRLYMKQFGWDDTLIVIAMIFSISETFTSWMFARYGYLGVHYWQIPADVDTVTMNQYKFAAQLLYNPILALVKASVLLFLRRLEAQSKRYRTYIWLLFWINMGCMVSYFMTDLFQCLPISDMWTTVKTGECIDQFAFYTSTAVITIVTDILTLILPTMVMMDLMIPTRKKLVVIGVLSSGGVVTIISIWRLVFFVDFFYLGGVTDPDANYDISFVSTQVEVNLAIITASAPAMKFMVSKIFPRFMQSSGNPGSYFTRSQGGTTKNKYSRHSNIQLASRTGPHNYDMPNITCTAGRGESPNGLGDFSDEEGFVAKGKDVGIVKTTDVTVSHTSANVSHDGRDSLRNGGKPASIDSLV